MALTFADYKSLVDHALHGGAPNAVYTDAATTRAQIVNEAGRHMVGLHPWPFRKRPPTTLTLVASQAYVDMPSDFGEIISLNSSDGINVDVYMTSAAEVESYRSVNSPSVGSYYVGYLSYPTQTATTALAAGARLEIEPAGTAGDTFTLVYRAGWLELAVDANVPNIPIQFESLLCQYVQAFARYQDNNEFDAILAIDQGPMVQARLRESSRRQWQYGTINNGAMMGTFGIVNRFDSSASVSDPS